MTRVYNGLLRVLQRDDGGYDAAISSSSSSDRPDRQDDKRIFFDDIFGSVSYEPEEKLPVSNCTCSEYTQIKSIVGFSAIPDRFTRVTSCRVWGQAVTESGFFFFF